MATRTDLNRALAPEVLPIRQVHFPEIDSFKLKNGIPVYIIPFGGQDIVELRLVSGGGKRYESVKGQAGFTAKMLPEGTATYTGYEFAQKLDEFGAFLGTDSGFDSSIFNLTVLEKHLGSVLPLLAELSLKPTFPEEEFTKMRDRTLQRLEVQEKNTAFVARREFNKLLFGPDHPYGSSSGKEEVKAVQLESLKAFHEDRNHPRNWAFVVSGRFSEKYLLDSLNEYFGEIDLNGNGSMQSNSLSNISPASGFHSFEVPDGTQGTIRLGHVGFQRNHPDFHRVQMVNTILGGYFGSRLMKNIREEKGYTYSIGSGWISYKDAGLFVIQTDVGIEYVDPALKEIKKELHKLINEGVSSDELEMVRNYLMGRSISGRETPSQIADLVTNYLVMDIPFNRIDEKFEVIRDISVQEINDLIQLYIQPEKLLEVVAGNGIQVG